jgi:hypothetical protein
VGFDKLSSDDGHCRYRPPAKSKIAGQTGAREPLSAVDPRLDHRPRWQTRDLPAICLQAAPVRAKNDLAYVRTITTESPLSQNATASFLRAQIDVRYVSMAKAKKISLERQQVAKLYSELVASQLVKFRLRVSKLLAGPNAVLLTPSW